MIEEPDRQPTTDLSGRTALITGAGSGMGRAMALTFARNGAEIMVCDLIAERVEETIALIEADSGKAYPGIGDVSDEAAVEAIVAAAIERWGRIDILCNNAGVMDRMQFLGDVSTELWRKIFSVNVDGVFFMLRAVLPHMQRAKRGCIVNTASEAGLRGGGAGGAYVASKHAVVGLTKSVAWNHAPDGIRCNAICPGATDTNITGGLGVDYFDAGGFARALPVMGLCERFSGPQAQANAALFLVSDMAYFVNGAIVPVDAGWSAG